MFTKAKDFVSWLICYATFYHGVAFFWMFIAARMKCRRWAPSSCEPMDAWFRLEDYEYWLAFGIPLILLAAGISCIGSKSTKNSRGYY